MTFSFTRTHAIHRFLPFHLPLCWIIYFYLHRPPHHSVNIFQHSLVHIYLSLCHFFCLSLLVKIFLFLSLSKHLFLPKLVGNFLLDFLSLLSLSLSQSIFFNNWFIHIFLCRFYISLSLCIILYFSLRQNVYKFYPFLSQSIHFYPPFHFVSNTFSSLILSLFHSFYFQATTASDFFLICFVC